MNNFKQNPNRPREFKAYVPLTDVDRAKYAGLEVSHIRLEVEYSLGGVNYFSGGMNKRGYRLSVTPVAIQQVGDHITSESYALLSDRRNSGGYVMIEEAARFNGRRLRELAEVYDPDVNEIARVVINDDVTRLVELVRGKVSAHV